MSSRPLIATTAESVVTAFAGAKPSWITLPSKDEELPSELRLALADFDAGGRPAAKAAGDWLRTEAVAAHQTSRTRLLIASGRIAGFYSLASAQVELSQHDRRRAAVAPVRVPAALITWIAKDRRTEIEGKLLLLHAVATARRAAELQATAVLVADPFDERTAAMWRKRYGFRPSAEPRKPKRLWLPLEPAG
ncbi:MAG TPA: hypothetical protein VK721_10975 [Solirubrobacteraceae bacterium]|jgi:hypothetical protein|nr:hypothetical protein [Solirubrobacteraceae bacterium]